MLSVFINLPFIVLLPLTKVAAFLGPLSQVIIFTSHHTLCSGERTDSHNVSDCLSATDVRICMNTALLPELWVIRPGLVHLTFHLTFIFVCLSAISNSASPHPANSFSNALRSVNDTEVHPLSQAHLLVSRKSYQSNFQNISQIIFPLFCLQQNHHNQA